MWNTRFMSRLFSATEEGDEELTEQVANDIEEARENGSVDTDEVRYEDEGDGTVSITDKENGEVTIAERAEDGNYDLYPAQVTENLEGYLHPEMDGVTPGQQYNPAAGEDAFAHIQSGMISPNVPGYGLNPQAGYEPSVEELAQLGPEGERKFSVSTNNTAVLKIFSDQAFCERLFSEVIESEETAKVGELKVEKDPEEENTVIVTNETTGDQAKVTLEDDEMEVTELESKNFCGAEGCDESDFSTEGPDEYDALHVVGVDAENHVMVDAPEYSEESAQELAQELSMSGVQGVEIFDNAEDARDYAIDLLNNLGAETESDIEEPVQTEFSDHVVYVTKFYSNHTDYMTRLFSEAADGIDASQSEIEDAIENGDEIETDDEIITPIDSTTAVIEDKENGEFTKVTLAGDELDAEAISEDEAEELTKDLEVSEEENDEDAPVEEQVAKEFSNIWSSDDLTRYFSEDEILTDYMVRMFSDEADEEAIEDAIENGDEIETDDEIITPVDATTAVIEDKESGEFTKAVMNDDDIDLEAITEEEADELTKDLEVSEEENDEDETVEEKLEKEFSDVWVSDDLTRYFSEDEILTDLMVRMFSDEDDDTEEKIADAIENGDQIETDDEVITPVDATTAVVEDKESGEFTKAVLDGEDGVELEAISEDEADALTEDLEVEDTEEDEDEEKTFSDYFMDGMGDFVLEKFFADAMVQRAQGQPQVTQLFDEQGNPVPVGMDEQGNPVQLEDPNAQQGGPVGGEQPGMVPGDPNMMAQEQGPSVEVIEDKALQAVNQIQQAAQEASNMIMQAKEAPVQGQEQDLQEAQFSAYDDYGYLGAEDTLVSWLSNNQRF